MELLKFDKKSTYSIFLMKEISKMLKQGSFNIFLHCVTRYGEFFGNRLNERDEIARKVKNILKTGLYTEGTHGAGRYGSINGIARFMGDAKSVDLDQIIDYDFLAHSRYINTIILSIPKYIQLDDQTHEFSSLNGKMKHQTRHIKDCLLDISKGPYLPPEFTFGYQLVDTKTNSVKFWKNERHISLLPKAEQDKIMQQFVTEIQNVRQYCKSKYKIEDFEEIFKIMTEEHLEIIDDYLLDI